MRRAQLGAASVLLLMVLACVVKSAYEYFYGPLIPGASNGQTVQDVPKGKPEALHAERVAGESAK